MFSLRRLPLQDIAFVDAFDRLLNPHGLVGTAHLGNETEHHLNFAAPATRVLIEDAMRGAFPKTPRALSGVGSG